MHSTDQEDCWPLVKLRIQRLAPEPRRMRILIGHRCMSLGRLDSDIYHPHVQHLARADSISTDTLLKGSSKMEAALRKGEQYQGYLVQPALHRCKHNRTPAYIGAVSGYS